MAPAYDYSLVADIYDDFCVFDADIDYFLEVTSKVGGPILELMAGTGRVSLPLIRGGARLTCVDRFPPMLAVLGRKLRSNNLSAPLVCADVCSLPFSDGRFEMVILPFQGLTELVGSGPQRMVFAEAELVPGLKKLGSCHGPRPLPLSRAKRPNVSLLLSEMLRVVKPDGAVALARHWCVLAVFARRPP